MPTGTRIRDNNVYGLTTDNPLTAGAVTFNSIGLANMSAVVANHAVVTLDPLREFGEPEIVVVTTHTAAATVATITRGQYGTVARSHPQNTTWVMAPLDEDFIEILTSSTRPTDPYRGQMIFETDTDKFVARNAANATWQSIAALGQWDTYAPVVTQLGTVPFTSTQVAWTRQGRLITVHGVLTVSGAGGTAGNGVFVTLPVAARTAVSNRHIIGSGQILDISAGVFACGLALIAGSNLTFGFIDTSVAAGGNLGQAGTAFTAALASTDVISYNLTYEALNA